MLTTINGHEIEYKKLNNKVIATIRDTDYDVEDDYNTKVADTRFRLSMFYHLPDVMRASATCHDEDKDNYNYFHGMALAGKRLQLKYWRKYVNVLRDNLIAFDNITNKLDEIGRSVDKKIEECEVLFKCDFEDCHE